MSTGLLARVALMLGNFVIGVGILAPAGMLDQLADGLAVTVATGPGWADAGRRPGAGAGG